MRISVALLALAGAMAACAQNNPPEAGVVATPPPPFEKPVIIEKEKVFERRVEGDKKSTANQCEGLPKSYCEMIVSCRWIKRIEKTDKNGRPLTDYCRRA